MRANLPDDLPPTIHAVEYAPHAALFPRASVVVHHGGIGTSSEALYAGKPMLVVPYGFDQPDNATRLKRLGVAEILPARRYRLHRAVASLERLLSQSRHAKQAVGCAAALRKDTAAADVVELIELI